MSIKTCPTATYTLYPIDIQKIMEREESFQTDLFLFSLLMYEGILLLFLFLILKPRKHEGRNNGLIDLSGATCYLTTVILIENYNLILCHACFSGQLEFPWIYPYFDGHGVT